MEEEKGSKKGQDAGERKKVKNKKKKDAMRCNAIK